MDPTTRSRDRRRFIGGSDARIIMGSDEQALIQLWREKRGEVGPEDLSGNLVANRCRGSAVARAPMSVAKN
jgi:predicted phage-related endonuclease